MTSNDNSMKKHSQPGNLLDKHLESVAGMQEAETDPFFYTRLRAKMNRRDLSDSNRFRAGWAIAVLTILLVVNSIMLVKRNGSAQANEASLQSFAAAYDLTIQSPF